MSSIHAVASLAGVSKSTVSRVLTDHPSVSESAATAVRQAMEQLKYRPRGRRKQPIQSARLQGEATGHVGLAAFALLLPEMRGGYYPSLVKGFDEGAGEVSHQVITCGTDNDVRKQGDLVLHLIDKRVAGVAMLPPTVGPAPTHQIRQLQSNGIPVVLLHRGVPDVQAPVIQMPYGKIARRAAQALLEAGHRRISAWFSHHTHASDQYEAALRDEVGRAGGTARLTIRYGDAPVVGHSIAQEQAVERMLAGMLSLPPEERPTALFTPWDDLAELLYLLLQRHGLSVPKDVSLVSFGGAWRGSPMRERISAVTVDQEETGRLAARMLHELSDLGAPRARLVDREVSVRFHQGQTLAAPQVPG